MSGQGPGDESPPAVQRGLPIPPLPPKAKLEWCSEGPGHVEITRTRTPIGRSVRRAAVVLGVWLLIAAILILGFPGLGGDIGIGWVVALFWLPVAAVWIAWILQSIHPPACGVRDGR